MADIGKDHKGISIADNGDIKVLTGVLDEFAKFEDLMALPEPLKLDLAGVTRFNSIGIRNLLGFLRSWPGKVYRFYNCPVEFVDQVNLIPALLNIGGDGKIMSLSAPYQCQKCGHEDTIHFDEAGLDGIAAAKAPTTFPCPKCQSPMLPEFDGFFAFLGA